MLDCDDEEREAVQEEHAYREPVRVGSPTVATRTTCRATGCGKIVEVTEAALECLAVSNRELARNGEKRLELRDCVFCDPCGKLFADARRRDGEEKSRKVREYIRQLTDDPAPRGFEHTEREALDYITRYCDSGNAVVAAILEKRRGGGSGGGRGRI